MVLRSSSFEDHVEDLRIERDFYRQLLALESRGNIDTLLSNALKLIVTLTGAQQAYLELRQSDARERTWWLARGCSDDDVHTIRDMVSRGVIAEALSTGSTVTTASALVDPRFNKQASVLEHGIQAVLCAPIGKPTPRGVVYVQGATDRGAFERVDVQRAELFAQRLATLADDLLARVPRPEGDFTAAVRARFACTSFVGRSRAIASVLEQAALLAPLDVDVLITGPSGTGKTALAEIIAQNSSRSNEPIVEVNCAAIPNSLIESELFGALKGAHSTAMRAMPGKIEAAEGGTLVLDEVAELSTGAQAKLLQFLQSRQYYPLGAVQPRTADVRIIAATNSDLPKMVEERLFREDLYYRLHVIPLHIPGLEERREDIDDLVARFIDIVARRHGLRPTGITPAALVACREASWPGNVRELANAIQAAVIRAHGAGCDLVDCHHLFPGHDTNLTSDALTFQAATRRFQKTFLQDALERGGWNVTAVAQDLGLTRSHMYNLIRGHGLRRTQD